MKENKRSTFINVRLSEEVKQEIINILKEYEDYFMWNYDEILGLRRDLVIHRLLI